MINRRSVKSVTQTLFARPDLMNRFTECLRNSARAEGCVETEVEATGEIEICPSRLHADFARMMRDEAPEHEENAHALANIRDELDLLGFVPKPWNRSYHNWSLGLAGEVDARGEIDGMPTLVELKVVRSIGAVVRPQDAAQLLLYDLLRNGFVGGSVLMALYVQDHAPFRAESRIVVNPTALAPLVRQLLA